jgi:hypothetical protein
MWTRGSAAIAVGLAMGCAPEDPGGLPGPAALSGLFLFGYTWERTFSEPEEEELWLTFSSAGDELILMGQFTAGGPWDDPRFEVRWEDQEEYTSAAGSFDATYSWDVTVAGRFEGPDRLEGTRTHVITCDGTTCDDDNTGTRTSPFEAVRLPLDTGLE